MKTDKKINLDYRNTSYKLFDFTIEEKKALFSEEFKAMHPKAWHVHNHINNKKHPLNNRFRSMYHDKCVYCGISTQVIDSSSFEVDHVLPKAVLKLELNYKAEDIHGLGNLVNSCKMCNRAKSSFICDEENIENLHPDNNNLHLIYRRDSSFAIEINKEYEDNKIVKEFYDALKLDNQLRRLDYLLMEMKDFCEEYEEDPLTEKIHKLIREVESKRRRNY